jgi:8-oxo-dGTP diphosphatase
MLRRKRTGWMDGSFSISAGGLDAGETLRGAAIREAYEEVGVRIAAEDLQYVHTLHSKTEGTPWLGHFFQAKVWHGTPGVREPDKHGDLQWQPINALPDDTIPYVRQAILAIAAQEPYSEYGW